LSRSTVTVPADYASLPREQLVKIVAKLLAVIQILERENEELQRAAKRQTPLFSKGTKPGPHKRPGRRPGQGQFTNRCPPTPEEITDEVVIPDPEVCPCCGESDLEITREDAFTTEVPEPRPKVTHYSRPMGHCRRCDHRWRVSHPDLADDQFGATAHRLGPRLKSAAHVLHYRLGLTVCKTPLVLEALHGVRVTQSALTQDALRTAKAGPLRERYEEIKARFAKAPVVHVDPTGWRKAGQSACLIAFATRDTPHQAGQTLYHVRDHHGADEVTEVLGENFEGVLASDRGPEFDAKKLAKWRKQKCNTHLKRNVGKVLETKVNAARDFGVQLRALLDEARHLRRAHDAGDRKGYAKRVASLEARLTDHLRPRTLTDPDNQRLLNEIGRQHDEGHVLRFLHDFNLSPDNHLAEQQIRFAVIARKVSHCSKNDAGADAHGVHSTVYQTENRAERFEQTGRTLVDRVMGLFKLRPKPPRRAQASPLAPTERPARRQSPRSR
jgi:transposase